MSLFKKIKVTKEGVYLLDPEYRKKFNKLTLSPSTINAWLSSPADFVLNKFILDEVSEREAPHFTRGKWFHSTMEEFYKAGKIRAIGVSNFGPDRYLDLEYFSEIKPAVNQVETHVFQQQKTAREYMQKYGCQIESWGPFAEGKNGLFTNSVLTEIGKKYEKTAAQTALRFLLQSDVVVIPKSVHKERMKQNIDVFDFTLTAEDMAAIEALDGGESLFFSHYDPKTVEWFMSIL